MTLRVPEIEMQDEALRVRFRAVILRVLRAPAAEHLAPGKAPMHEVRGIERVGGLVPEQAHALLLAAPFHLEHLPLLELFEPWMRQIKWDGDPRHAVR